jgi:hypothetical protein
MVTVKANMGERTMWLPANGGTETPYITRTGHRVLYMWNRATGEHDWYIFALDQFVGQDIERQIQFGIVF